MRGLSCSLKEQGALGFVVNYYCLRSKVNTLWHALKAKTKIAVELVHKSF